MKTVVPAALSQRPLLTGAEFQRLANVPPEVEWFKNIRNPHTKRAYQYAIKEFMLFTGIQRPEEFRSVTPAHVIAWREVLGSEGRRIGGASIRHRMAALSSLFQYLCHKNAVTHNPVKGVKRPRSENGEGKTPAIADHQARELLVSPAEKSLKGIRDRAILATLLYHRLRREESLHGVAKDLIEEYLELAGHGGDAKGALFRPLRDASGGGRKRAITPDGVYKLVRRYSSALGFEIGAHALRATAATNALDHQADIAKVQEWLGHSNNRHDPAIRSPQNATRGQPDVQGHILGAPLNAACLAGII